MTLDLALLYSYNFHRQRNTVMDSIFMVAVEHNKLAKDVADALDLTEYYDAKLPEYTMP